MIAIKHRFSGSNICEFNVETIKKAVELGKYNLQYANLQDLDLYGAKLCGANLNNADLFSADLRSADLYGSDLCGARLYYADLRYSDLRKANLYGADLSYAKLHGAILRGIDLRGVNLSDADLSGANLDGEKLKNNPLFIYGMEYFCIITEGYMRLGCQRHTHEQWENFTDLEIKSMDSCAIEFWNKNKTFLFAACNSHKAQSIK